MKNANGISLITLIITIIVIIVLAAIVIFTGLNTPERAQFAKFTQDFSGFQEVVTNTFLNEKMKLSTSGQYRTDEQIYYKIATGIDTQDTPPATGTVADLNLDLQGNNFYQVSADEIAGMKIQNKFLDVAENLFITDKGEVFALPGYLVEENGTNQWYVNSSVHYVGDAPVVDGNTIPRIATANIEVGDYVYYEGTGSCELLQSKTGLDNTQALAAGYLNGKRYLSGDNTSWRVWDVEKDGNGNITSIVIIPTNRIHVIELSGDTGFMNYESVLQDICNMYVNPSMGVTSVRCLDIEELEKTKVSNVSSIKWKYTNHNIEYGKTYSQIYGGEGYTSGNFLTEDDGLTVVSSPRTSGYPINLKSTYYVLSTSGNYTNGEPLEWTEFSTTATKTGITNRGELFNSICYLKSPCVALTSSIYALYYIRVVDNSYISASGLYVSTGQAAFSDCGVCPLITLSASLQVVGADENSGTEGNPWVFQK